MSACVSEPVCPRFPLQWAAESEDISAMTESLIRLQSRKNALRESRLTETPLAPLGVDQVRLRIRCLALTTNNVTYLTFGEAPIHYWSYFPTDDAPWAQMPAWGFADVIESNASGIAVGERFYGFFPVASHLDVLAERVTARGFYDGSAHRRQLTSAYNQYTRCAQDPAYRESLENLQALLRPLFVTSFVLADFLEEREFFAAKRLIFSSASSKTAFGAAYCLQHRPELELVALTSAKNRDFVSALGCYSLVLDYADLETLGRDRSTLYVDFSGDHHLRARVHEHLGENLVYDCLVGFAQTRQMLEQGELVGPRPSFFFAPEQIGKRTRDWGAEGFNQRFNAAQSGFMDQVSVADNPWMTVLEHQGLGAAQSLIADLLDGHMDPRAGHIVQMTRDVTTDDGRAVQA